MSKVKTAQEAGERIRADHADYDKQIAAGNMDAAKADVDDAVDLIRQFGLDDDGQSVESNGAEEAGYSDAGTGGEDDEDLEEVLEELRAELGNGEIDC